MSKRSGYVWESTFKKSVQTYLPEAFIFKIIDTHSIEGLLSILRKSHTQYENYMIPKVPSDFIIVWNGKTMWVECKNTHNKTSFPLSNIKKHQLEFGKAIVRAGGEYFLAIQRDKPYHKRAFLIDLETFLKMELRAIKEKRKSIKWELFELESGVKEMRLLKNSLYNIKGVLE